MTLKIRVGIGDWDVGLEIGIWRLGIGDWDWGLGISIRVWDWGLGF